MVRVAGVDGFAYCLSDCFDGRGPVGSICAVTSVRAIGPVRTVLAVGAGVTFVTLVAFISLVTFIAFRADDLVRKGDAKRVALSNNDSLDSPDSFETGASLVSLCLQPGRFLHGSAHTGSSQPCPRGKPTSLYGSRSPPA